MIDPPLPEPERHRILRQATFGLIPYAVATGVAFVSPYASLAICASLLVFYATPLGVRGQPRAGQGRVRISYASGRRVVRNGNSSSQSRR